METIIIICAIIAGAVIGFAVAKYLEKNNASSIIKNAQNEAKGILKDARAEGETIKKDKILQAKEKFIELKSEHEQVILSRDKKIAEAEKRTRDKESQISNELNRAKKAAEESEKSIKEYELKLQVLEKKQEETDKLHRVQVEKLEQIDGLTAEEATLQLVESIKAEANTQAMSYIQDTIEEAKMTAQQVARKIIINTSQRVGTEEAIENCVSVFNIESDDVKGRIIGREGRNIRALEA